MGAVWKTTKHCAPRLIAVYAIHASSTATNKEDEEEKADDEMEPATSWGFFVKKFEHEEDKCDFSELLRSTLPGKGTPQAKDEECEEDGVDT